MNDIDRFAAEEEHKKALRKGGLLQKKSKPESSHEGRRRVIEPFVFGKLEK